MLAFALTVKKAMENKTVSDLALITAVVPNYISSHCILHCHTFGGVGGGKQVHLKNVGGAVKITFIKSQPLSVCLFNILSEPEGTHKAPAKQL